MISRTFFYNSIKISIVVMGIIALFNVTVDDYGLFGNVSGREIKIYSYLGSERLSKHLFSYHYIPSNFEGILIGSSVSDNLNTKLIQEFKIYNASLIGGNISELRYIVDNLIKNNKKISFMIICLDPYITKDSGRKTSYIHPREYWGALGSLDTLKMHFSKLFVYIHLLPDYCNDYGYYNFNVDKVGIDSEQAIKEAARRGRIEKIEIDNAAFRDLKGVVGNAKKHGLRVFAFYYPRPRELYLLNKQSYSAYQAIINSAFSPEDFVWDFNAEHYKEFTRDYKNYSDSGHLSDAGALFLLKEIQEKILQAYAS